MDLTVSGYFLCRNGVDDFILSSCQSMPVDLEEEEESEAKVLLSSGPRWFMIV